MDCCRRLRLWYTHKNKSLSVAIFHQHTQIDRFMINYDDDDDDGNNKNGKKLIVTDL